VEDPDEVADRPGEAELDQAGVGIGQWGDGSLLDLVEHGRAAGVDVAEVGVDAAQARRSSGLDVGAETHFEGKYREPEMGDVVADEGVGDPASWFSDRDDEVYTGIVGPGEARRGARLRHAIGEHRVGRDDDRSLRRTARPAEPLDHPAVLNEAVHGREQRCRRPAFEVGQGVVETRCIVEDQSVWRVEADLEVAIIAAYDVEPVAKDGLDEVAPRRCHHGIDRATPSAYRCGCLHSHGRDARTAPPPRGDAVR
jgi:hypothetical protein